MIKDLFVLATLNGELGYTPTALEYAEAVDNVFNYNIWYPRSHYLNAKGRMPYYDDFEEQLAILYLDSNNRLRANTTAFIDGLKIGNYLQLPTVEYEHNILAFSKYSDILPKGNVLHYREHNIFDAPRYYSPFYEFNGFEDLCQYLIKVTDNELLITPEDFIFIPKFWRVKTKDGWYADLVSDVYKLDMHKELLGSFCMHVESS